MSGKDKSTKDDAPKGKGVVVTLTLTPEDAHRLQEAFDENRLKDLRITELQFGPEESDHSKKNWSQEEKRKRRKARDSKTPPLP